MKFYLMGNGKYVAEAYRGTTVRAIRKLQREEWARRQGGICKIVDLIEERAIYFAMRGN